MVVNPSEQPNITADTPALQAVQVMRAVAPLSPAEPLGRALHALRRQQATGLPVVEGGRLLGWVTDARLAEVVVANPGMLDHLPVRAAVELPPRPVDPGTSIADLPALFTEAGVSCLPVVAWDERYLGCVQFGDVLAALASRYAPPHIGGLATPLGVYLTTGSVSGGVGNLGLILAGAVMAFMLWVAQVGLALLAAGLYRIAGWSWLRALALVTMGYPAQTGALTEFWLSILSSLLLMLLFLTLLRLAPRLAGYHAAEHQTVHAIEAGEPLLPEVVARMPRVHPRCGTNLWAIMALSFLGMAMLATILSTQLGRAYLGAVVPFALACVLVVIISWRQVGGWLQAYFTTRRAAPAELASGIRAGQAVIRNHLATPLRPPARPFTRLWRMGMPQAALGIAILWTLLQLLTPLLDDALQSLVK